MIKKILIPVLLLTAIVILAYQFFKPSENGLEELNAFALLPSTTIAFEINNDEQDNFLGLSSQSKSRFICDDFPKEIAGCIILADSIVKNDSLMATLAISESYSNQNIFKINEAYFFIDGRKVYHAKNIVLLKQLLLKVQNKDFFTANQQQQSLQALVKESRVYFASLIQNIFIEYNEVNDIANAYRFSTEKQNAIKGVALNFLPKSAKKVRLNKDTLSFEWGEKTFLISEDNDKSICKNKYRDAKICVNDSSYSAIINGIKITANSNENIYALIDDFYAGKCFKNEQNSSNIDFLHSFSVLPNALKKLLPTNLSNSTLISYANGKSLQVIKFENASTQTVDLKNSEENYSIAFNSDIIWGPYAVKNHRSNSKCLFIQCADNTLYFLNSKGKQLWKASIDGKILGAPIEIDIFHNNKVQYVFNTSVKLYQLDVLGRNLNGYPKRIEATGPVALVTYKAKKERLLIPSGNSVKNLYLNGNKTRGWKEIKLGSTVQNIAYTKQKTTDCIMVKCKEMVYILNPRGEKRNTPQKTNKNSLSYIDKNKLHSNIFSLNEENKLLINNDKDSESELFGENTFDQLIDLGNYVYAISKEQLVLLTTEGNLVENRFVNEAPISFENGVLYNSDNVYTAFISPGTRIQLKTPIKALRAALLSDKLSYSINKELIFIDYQ